MDLKEILIIFSVVTIPALSTLFAIIFKNLSNYKKSLIIAQKGTDELHKLVDKLKLELDKAIKDNEILRKENKELKQRIELLEKKKNRT